MHELVDKAVQLQRQGQFREAELRLTERLQVDPGDADAWRHLGLSAYFLGNREDAVSFLEKAIELDAEIAEAHYNLGVIRAELQEFDSAERAYRRSLEICPESNPARNNLGGLLFFLGRLTESLEQLKDADPASHSAEAEVRIANVEKSAGLIPAAVDRYQRACQLAANDPTIFSKYLFALQYDPNLPSKRLVELHAEWNERYAASNEGDIPGRSSHQRTREESIRLGFVSPDLRNHPVGYFLAPLLERLSQVEFQTFAYSDVNFADETNRRLRKSVAKYHECEHLDDELLWQQIQDDQIDILFDLAGHTDNNRLRLFARRAAPIQVSWAGYVGTTGIRDMDYLLCDRFHVPGDSSWVGSERPLYMPKNYVPFEPPAFDLLPVEPPLLRTGHVTFGSFNNISKINKDVIATWSQILLETPESRLLLKFKSFDDPGVQDRFLQRFRHHGIEANRIELRGQSSRREHLEAYRQIDIALDTFPYSGGLTTCEAIWMGVPVVTFPGDRFASRHSYSHLSNAGLTESIAGDRCDYVRIAVELAGNVPRLAAIRRKMRTKLLDSPLSDLDQFAADFAALMQSVIANTNLDLKR